eukprot:4016826-Pleurochrysis_carterae.AAC.2
MRVADNACTLRLCARAAWSPLLRQDAHADESYARARAAHSAGHFASEVEPVVVSSRKGSRTVDADEEPQES